MFQLPERKINVSVLQQAQAGFRAQRASCLRDTDGSFQAVKCSVCDADHRLRKNGFIPLLLHVPKWRSQR